MLTTRDIIGFILFITIWIILKSLPAQTGSTAAEENRAKILKALSADH